jgi:hypothetical protein
MEDRMEDRKGRKWCACGDALADGIVGMECENEKCRSYAGPEHDDKCEGIEGGDCACRPRRLASTLPPYGYDMPPETIGEAEALACEWLLFADGCPDDARALSLTRLILGVRRRGLADGRAAR